MRLHPAAPRGWVEWVTAVLLSWSGFSIYVDRRGMASPKDNLAEKQKRRSTPDSGGTAPGKTLTAASKLRPGGFGEESWETGVNTVYSISMLLSILYVVNQTDSLEEPLFALDSSNQITYNGQRRKIIFAL